MASSSITGAWTEGLTPTIQTYMDNYVSANNPQTIFAGAPTLETVIRSSNGNLGRQVNTGDGSRNESTNNGKNVRIDYYQRFRKDQTRDSIPDTCDPEIESKPLERTVEVTKEISSYRMEIDEWELRRIPEGQDEYLQHRLQSMLNAMLEKLNDETAILMAGKIGEYKDGSTSKTFNVLKADGSIHPTGYAQISKEMRDVYMSGPLYICGAGNVWYETAFMQQMKAANDAGQNLPAMDNLMVTYDPVLSDANKTNNANGAFMFGQDAFNFVTWNANSARYRKANDIFFHDTITYGGITFDFNGEYTHCGTKKRKWSVWFELSYDLHETVPSDAFHSTDELYGVNYTFKSIGGQLS